MRLSDQIPECLQGDGEFDRDEIEAFLGARREILLASGEKELLALGGPLTPLDRLPLGVRRRLAEYLTEKKGRERPMNGAGISKGWGGLPGRGAAVGERQDAKLEAARQALEAIKPAIRLLDDGLPDSVVGAPGLTPESNAEGAKFDRAAYMREYMRKRREKAKRDES